MNIAEWCQYIESIHLQEMDLTLDRIRMVADQLNVLPVSVPVLMVAGTNGKGTTTAFLTHCLCQLGYDVGSHTSPHLLAINERFVINGQPITDDHLCQAFAAIEQARGKILLTFFEFCVLAALYWFRQCSVDVLVLEVGLGGRLDAVNVVDADVAIITNIALDHQQWLGPDRDAIGREKAGICRLGKPVICGDENPPDAMLATIQQAGAKLIQSNRDFCVELQDNTWQWRGMGYVYSNLPLPNIPLQNAATAMAALQCLPMLDKTFNSLFWRDALTQVRVLGRYQRFALPQQVIVDVAHNPDAAQYLLCQLQAHPVRGKTYALFSALADKDISGIVRTIAPAIDAWSYAPLTCPRAASMVDLAAVLPTLAQREVDVLAACQKIISQLQPDDRLVVFGSFFTVGAVLPWLIEQSKNAPIT